MAIGILAVMAIANPSANRAIPMQPDKKTTSSSGTGPSSPAAHPLSAMLDGVNHEIRTAMNGIVGLLDMLLEAGLPSVQRELAATAQHSAENLLGFMETAVDLAAINEGSLRLDTRQFELSSTLRAAIDGTGIPGLRLTRPLPAALLQGDAGRIKQLVSGMLRIGQSAGRTLDIDVRAEYRDGRCALAIDLTAGKCGAEAAHAIKLFDSTPAGIEVVHGHGRLGMEIELCKRLAGLMGGSILMCQPAQASCMLNLALALPLAAPSLEGGGLLIIEKDEADRQLLQTLFARHGMAVQCFASAQPALDALRENAGAIRMAIIGRDETGLDAELLAAAIKADPQLRTVQLAALCDDASTEMTPALAQAGFDAAIARPLDEAAALMALAAPCGCKAEPGQPLLFSSASGQDFSGRRILVADDNSVNLQVARHMLEKHGCRVDVAGDGAEALAMHQAAPYDLVLMDCQMPVMDGRDAAKRIRTLEGAAGRVPVLAVTACVTPSERDCCLAAGMDDFIAKPLRPHILDAALAKWLRAQMPAKTAPAESPRRDELDAVKDMFGADFGELARLYRNDSPPRIAALHDAAAAGDWTAVAKVAHAFSGSSASIGASGLAALCKELELQAKTGSIAEFAERMSTIENEYERICKRLEALLEEERQTPWQKN